MKKFLTSRWFLSFIGVLLLGLLVWFLGPLLAFLENWIVRAAIVAGLLLIWALVNFLLDLNHRKSDKALTDGVASVSPGQVAKDDEVAEVHEKLTKALNLLRQASGSRGYLYEQPWYVIIGPPGAGKTTALLNAGLKFPLAAEMGQTAIAGVGGTRMCEWWFTEQAVMIDTAGRYTTQDSDAGVDKAGWEGFLDLLKRTRPRQPLNGVLVAIAAPDLASASSAERLDHARAVRRRVKELNDKLGVKLPVYVLFTKLDLLSGFTEFFDDLDRERRDQVWGESFDVKQREGLGTESTARLAPVFRDLTNRLNDRLLERLQSERSPDRRALLVGFPAQFASLEAPLTEFLAEAFGSSRLDPGGFLRGLYFTSGTQSGTPIDRLTATLSHLFGVDQKRAPSLIPSKGRSYFLGNLLSNVVFGEAMLATTKPGAARQRDTARLVAFALIALITIGLSAAFVFSGLHQQAEAARVQQALTQYTQAAAAQQLDPVTSGDLSAVQPLLDAARNLPYGVSDKSSGGFGWGLSQESKFRQGDKSLYQNALNRVLLPRLLVRLEGQMRDNLQNPDFLYESTHVYLMLAGQGPLDSDLTRAWEQLDWQTQYPDPAVQADLTQHLNALLQSQLPEVTLDWGLVADARSALSRVSLAARVYSQIKLSGPAQQLNPWSPAQAMGATGLTIFSRGSGKQLSDGIPGFYTVEGFHSVLLPSLPEATAQVAKESWVLGKQSEVPVQPAAIEALQTDVIHLYETDYEKNWDGLIGDLSLAPLGSASQTSQTLYILSSPQSPFSNLMTSVAKELKLSKDPNPGSSAVNKRISGAESQLSGLLGASTKPTAPPGSEVDAYYKPFLDYVGGGAGSGSPMDLTIKLMGDLQKQVAQAAAAGAGGSAAPAPGGGDNPGQMLQATSAGQPALIGKIAQTITGGSNQVVNSNAKKSLDDAYSAPDGPGSLCSAAVNGRFPFVPGAGSEIPLADFGKLFGTGGLLDSFFNSQLRPFVNTGSSWSLQAVGGVNPPISQGDVNEFQRAAAIRNLFFANGGTTPAVSFTITPASLDDGTKQAVLSIGTNAVTYAHGPVQSTPVTWPGPGSDSVRLTFDGQVVASADGPWALFRLIGQGSLSQGASSELYLLSFTQGTKHITYQLRAGSVQNPFAPGVLQNFRCPSLN